MNYVENIFICLAAPLFIAILCARGRGKLMVVFLLTGMISCLLSSYISTFLAVVQGADMSVASLEIAPLVEEIMKFFPVLFYLLIFEPKWADVTDGIMILAVGFATFENVCYLIQNGAAQLLHLTIRGFGTGAMHVVCGGIVAAGIMRMWNSIRLRVAGTVGVLTVAICYHGTYNILASQEGAAALVGYLIPLVTALLGLIFRKKLYPDKG